MKLLFTALIATLSATCCLAQTGTVIFYTLGNTAKSTVAGLLPRSQQPFTGFLFDGPQRLAHVRPGRFMAFHLDPGAHAFTVRYQSNRPGNDPLVINVESGEQYCVRLYAKMTNTVVLPLPFVSGHIEQVPCKQAEREGARLKPIESKRIDAHVRARLDPATAFPSENDLRH